MRRFLIITLIGASFLISLPAFAAQVAIGVTIGPPPPPPVVYTVPPPPPPVVYAVPATPEPEYVWVEGYWYPVGPHWNWHRGYWTRAPYVGARWLAPRYERGQFFAGYWEGDRGRMPHDHHWDRDGDRDFREKGRGKGHDKEHGRGHDR